jgi:hypothetical protein
VRGQRPYLLFDAGAGGDDWAVPISADDLHLHRGHAGLLLLPGQSLPLLRAALRLSPGHPRLQAVRLRPPRRTQGRLHSRPRRQAEPRQSVRRLPLRRRFLRHPTQQLHHPRLSVGHCFSYLFYLVSREKENDGIQPIHIAFGLMLMLHFFTGSCCHWCIPLWSWP